MALWLLKGRKDIADYDIAVKFVVRARSENRARTLASQRAGDEKAGYWLDPRSSTCEKLMASGDDAVIIRDFRAG